MCASERSSGSGGGRAVSAAWRASAPASGAPEARAGGERACATAAPAGDAVRGGRIAPDKRPRSYRRRSGWGRELRQAEEIRVWEELLPHLPDGARRIWTALGDMRQLWRVLVAYGGRTLRIPCALPPATHALRRRLGVACLRGLVAAFGGTELYVPTCGRLLARLRQREIITEFSHATARGVSSVTAVARLAARHDLSDRRIWQILKTTASAPRGAAALRRLPQTLEAAREEAAKISD